MAETMFFEKRRETQRGRNEVQKKTIEEHLEQAKSLGIQIQASDQQIGSSTSSGRPSQRW
jgi:hypothetical protein